MFLLLNTLSIKRFLLNALSIKVFLFLSAFAINPLLANPQATTVTTPDGKVTYVFRPHIHVKSSNSTGLDNSNAAQAALESSSNNVNTADAGAIAANESNNQLTSIQASLEKLSDKLLNNRIKVLSLGVISIYGYMLYQLKSMESFLDDEYAWSKWRNELSIEGLYSINDSDLINDLLLAAQMRYKNINSLDDYMQPIKAFFEDVKKEKVIIKKYVKWTKVINKAPIIKKLFFINNQLVNEANSRLLRLKYLESKMYKQFSKNNVKRCMEFMGEL